MNINNISFTTFYSLSKRDCENIERIFGSGNIPTQNVSGKNVSFENVSKGKGKGRTIAIASAAVAVIAAGAVGGVLIFGGSDSTSGSGSRTTSEDTYSIKTASAAGGEEGYAINSVTEAVDFKVSDGAQDGKVYFLNYKPECAEQWVNLAAEFTEQTGIEVKIQTPASGTYASTRKAEMAKGEGAPTLFQVNGPNELDAWGDYCYNLKDTELYTQLKSDDFALIKDDEVKAVAYVIETYGIIYDKTALNDYFSKDYAVAKSVDEMNTFNKFKAVCDDIQAHKDDLGIKGAFTSAGLDSSSDWRFKTHLANLPIYYEYKKDGISSTDAIKGTYLDGYKKIWDLYITDSTCDPTALAAKTGDEARTEFTNGDAIFYQNGTWEYAGLIEGGFTDEELGMLPIYIGAEGEENQGLCTGSENYLCINAKAKEADIKATCDFVRWILTSDTGRTALAKDMGFTTPFKSFDDEKFATNNVLVKAADEYINAGKTSVTWNFTTIPGGDAWKNPLGEALKSYSLNGMSDAEWEKVKTAFVDGWAEQAKIMNEAGLEE